MNIRGPASFPFRILVNPLPSGFGKLSAPALWGGGLPTCASTFS